MYHTRVSRALTEREIVTSVSSALGQTVTFESILLPEQIEAFPGVVCQGKPLFCSFI